jgi:hypothetical protein
MISAIVGYGKKLNLQKNDSSTGDICMNQGRGVHVTGVSAAYTFKLNKNILSE